MSKRVFNFFKDFIPFYRQLRPITKSTLSSILAAKLEFWFERYPDGFYKFLEPAPGHKDYRLGDSWTEEIGFSAREFKSAFENIGVAYSSKSEFEKAENKFLKEATIPSYEIEKKFDEDKNKQIVKRTRERTNENTVEMKMFYCSYVDRKTNLTWYYKNYERDILEEALDFENTQNAKGDLQRIANPILADPDREKRSQENANSDLKESPFVDSSLFIVDNTKDNAIDTNFFSNTNTQEHPILIDLPNAEVLVKDHFKTNGNLDRKIHKKLRAIFKGKNLTQEELMNDCAAAGTIWKWLGENEQKVRSFTKSSYSRDGYSKAAAPAEESPCEKWARDFVTTKLIPLDTELNGGEQRMFFNRREHPKILQPAFEGKWPEQIILQRYRNYLNHGGYYAKAGHPLALFIAQFNNFKKKKRRLSDEEIEARRAERKRLDLLKRKPELAEKDWIKPDPKVQAESERIYQERKRQEEEWEREGQKVIAELKQRMAGEVPGW